jgi:branched-chain amino acid transport system substrate-binding protein
VPGSRNAAPIKFGVVQDAVLPDEAAWMRNDYVQSLELVFNDAFERGALDRRVEVIYKEADGLPYGTGKAVVDAFEELVDEGCLAIYGPNITDNSFPLREQIERRFRVPAINNGGSDEWLGEWTFALPNGSLTDEPIIWANLMAREGQTSAGMLVERSLVGATYEKSFRKACQYEGIRLIGVESIAQTGQDIRDAVHKLHESKPDAIVHCGFGLGVLMVNQALDELNWYPPRYMGTAFENGYVNEIVWEAFRGWIGLESYDEGNTLGQQFLDRYEAAYGRRPEYIIPVVNHDVANVFVQAFSDAEPLSPRGVKEALERVKMLPAASGSEGTRISFGKYDRMGWMGPRYLVARTMDPDGKKNGTLWKTNLFHRFLHD